MTNISVGDASPSVEESVDVTNAINPVLFPFTPFSDVLSLDHG